MPARVFCLSFKKEKKIKLTYFVFLLRLVLTTSSTHQTHYIACIGYEIVILLPQPLECGDYRPAPPHPVGFLS